MTTSDDHANTTLGGEQLSSSFAVYAEQVVTGYEQVQALLDMHSDPTTRMAIEALEAIVNSQQAMLQRMKALVQ